MDDAYPLGIRPGTSYKPVEIQLQPGDRIILCSDGIIEAKNAAGELFGFERSAEIIRQCCANGTGAEALVEQIIEGVRCFTANMPQVDDQTIVVLEVER